MIDTEKTSVLLQMDHEDFMIRIHGLEGRLLGNAAIETYAELRLLLETMTKEDRIALRALPEYVKFAHDIMVHGFGIPEEELEELKK